MYSKQRYFLILFLACIQLLSFGQLDRSVPPMPSASKALTIADFNTYTLDNGLHVIFVNDPCMELLNVSVHFNYLPKKEYVVAGISDFTFGLLGTATKYRVKDSLNNRIDFLGIEKYYDDNSFRLTGLPKYSSELLSLLSEIIVDAEFDSMEIEKLKKMVYSSMAFRRKDPELIADRISNKLIYGENHPLGQLYSEKNIATIKSNDCIRFYNSYITPNHATLIIHGNFRNDDMLHAIHKRFSKWQPSKNVLEERASMTKINSNQVYIIDKPESVQSTVRIMHPIEMKPGDSLYFKAVLANTILGGGTYRLFLNLREKNSFTYGAYSSLDFSPYGSFFEVYTDVRSSATDSAVKEVLWEMKRMQEELVPDDELDKVKSYLIGNFSVSLEKSSTIANMALAIYQYKLNEKYYKDYSLKMQSIVSEDIRSVSKILFKPENAIILIVGNSKIILPGLERFFKQENIYLIDVDGNLSINKNESSNSTGQVGKGNGRK